MITKFNYDNLLWIKNILEEFGNMSGLVCNVEKTVLLPIGINHLVDARIQGLGFSIAETVTILGLKINRNGFTDDNLLSIMEKISFWSPFNLSLPGRINIAKTMLYSQINYFGCVLPIADDMIAEYDKLIAD
jgi:hypothetical protein